MRNYTRKSPTTMIACKKCGVPRAVSDTPEGRYHARRVICRACADRELPETTRRGWALRRVREHG